MMNALVAGGGLVPGVGGETEGFGYQYPFSTQSHQVAACRWMSSCIRERRFELAKKRTRLMVSSLRGTHIPPWVGYSEWL